MPAIGPDLFEVNNWGYVKKINFELSTSSPIGRKNVFQDSTVFIAFKEFFINGTPWENTKFYKHILSSIRGGGEAMGTIV